MPMKISYWEGLVWKEGNFDFMRRRIDAVTKQHYLNLYKDGQDTIKIKPADFISARPI